MKCVDWESVEEAQRECHLIPEICLSNVCVMSGLQRGTVYAMCSDCLRAKGDVFGMFKQCQLVVMTHQR